MTDGLIVIQLLNRHAGIFSNMLIDRGLYEREFFIRNRSRVAEVEA